MAENKVLKTLFTENLRPKTLDQVLTFPRIKDGLKNGIQGNLLFYGIQGTGKTTIVRILRQGYDYMEINCSLERGIDTIREKLVSFCSSSSLFDDGGKSLKIIHLEEFDQMSNDAYLSLRSCMDQYAKNIRFVATVNFLERVPSPIQSRFECICMNPQTKEEERWLFSAYCGRVKQILTALKIAYTDEKVERFVRKTFPDFRSVIKTIQSMYTRNCTEIPDDISTDGSDLTSLLKIIMEKPDAWENYKQLQLEWSNNPDNAIIELGKTFPEYLNRTNPSLITKLPGTMITIAEHQAMLPQAADHFVVLLSLVYKLQILLNQ